MIIINNTPVQAVYVGPNSAKVWVKREDLCCPFPGPSFSKMRGVLAHIRSRPEQTIGVLDTFHSKAGWAVAWACRELGKTAVNFWPRYKADGMTPTPRTQQAQALGLGAYLRELPAGRSAILYHAARKRLAEEFPGAYLMPNALRLPESITENAAEAVRTCLSGAVPSNGLLILSVSSGTVAAGVVKGFALAGFLERYRVVFHMGYTRSISTMRSYMEKSTGLAMGDGYEFKFVDEGYGYGDKSHLGSDPGFPCNPYYDRKAWEYLTQNKDGMDWLGRENCVFWNIGA